MDFDGARGGLLEMGEMEEMEELEQPDNQKPEKATEGYPHAGITGNSKDSESKDQQQTESAQPSHVGFHGSKNQENTKPNPEKMAGTVKVYPTYTKLNP